jgi:hypothetical protein
MNEHVEEYQRRIHQAGGLPTEQASTPPTPRRAAAHWPLDGTRAAVSGAVHFATPPSRQREM